MNYSNIEKLLSQILMVLGGTNAMGVPNSALISGKSIGHAYTEHTRNTYRQSIVNPLSNAMMHMGGAQIYENTLRLMGYTSEAARAKATSPTDTGAAIARRLGAMWVDQQAGNDIRFYAQRTFDAMHRYNNRPSEATRKSYFQAGAEIFKGVSSGELGSYSLGEAFRMGGELVATGKYEGVDNKQRASIIKEDLKRYAKGVTDLKDALNGSLEEVLDSFESLAGNNAATMSSQKFNSLARAVYQTTVYGGASNQLLASAVATQHAYFQGTGTTRAHAVAAGSFNANVLAQGVNVEGASADGMEDALKKQQRIWLTTGRTKELAAAYAHYAEMNNMEQNQDTFKQFIKTIGGSASAQNVRSYLDKNKVSGSYMNREHVRRTMGQAEVTEGLAKSDIYDKYQKLYKSEILGDKSLTGLVTDKDISLSAEDFREKVKSRALQKGIRDKYIQRQLGGRSLNDISEEERQKLEKEADSATINSLSDVDKQEAIATAIQKADEAEASRNSVVKRVLPHATPEDAQNILNNMGKTLQDRSTYKSLPIDTYRKELAGIQSIKGMAGVFTKMIQQDNGTATVGKVLSGFYGVTMNPEMEDKLREIQKIKDPKKQQEALDEFIHTNIASGLDGEQKLINEGKKRIKTYKTRDMELRDRINNSKLSKYAKDEAHMHLNGVIIHRNTHSNTPNKLSRDGGRFNLDKLVEAGVISEDEAFRYEQEDFDSNWGLLKDKDKQTILNARKIAKDLGYKNEDAMAVSSLVKTIKTTAVGSEENVKARKELQNKIEKSSSFVDSTEDMAEDLKKGKAAQIASKMLGESYRNMNTDTMLTRIMQDVSRIANK